MLQPHIDFLTAAHKYLKVKTSLATQKLTGYEMTA